MQGAAKRTLRTSIAEAATSTVQLPMLVALPDELLDVVVDLCREAAAFVCLVCRRLSESEFFIGGGTEVFRYLSSESLAN